MVCLLRSNGIASNGIPNFKKRAVLFCLLMLRIGEAAQAFGRKRSLIRSDDETKLYKYDECIKSTYSRKYLCHRFQPNKKKDVPFCNFGNITVHFLGDSLMGEFQDAYQCLCGGSTVFHKAIKVPPDKSTARMFTKALPNDLIVMNFGLWYGLRQVKELTSQLERVKQLIEINLVENPSLQIVWVQTIAQHFCTKGGVYLRNANLKKYKNCCHIKRPNSFRIDAARKYLIEPLRGKLIEFDAFQLTQAWHESHPGLGDCTHLCADSGGPLHEMVDMLVGRIQNISSYQRKRLE